MSLTPRDLARAEALGRRAATCREGVDLCPYEANGDPDQRVLAGRFVRAYLAAGGTVDVDYDDGNSTAVRQAQTATGPARVTIQRRRPS